MTPDDLTAALSERLRRRGVNFNRAALEAFAADARREPAVELNIEALAERFRKAQEATTALSQQRVRAWAEGMALAAFGVLLLGFAALFGIGIAVARLDGSSADNTQNYLIGGCACAVGLTLVTAGCLRTVLGQRRPKEAASRADDSDGTS
jgi:hypothetical protein